MTSPNPNADITPKPVWDGEGKDPWLPARLQAMLDAGKAERSIYEVAWDALSSWLVTTTRLVMRGPTIDPEAVFSQEPAWQKAITHIIDDGIIPVMSWAYEGIFGPGYDWRDRPSVISYLAGVRNRLSHEPQEVFDLIAGQIAAGVTLGEGMSELTDRVDEVLSTTDSARWPNRAVTISRTECLLGDSLIESDGIQAVYRRWYQGPIFRVHMSSGQQFSGTANHPVLTSGGWVGFGALLPGDELVHNGAGQGLRTSGNEHVGDMPARICEVYDALAAVGVVVRTKTGKPDFHGDGMDGYVDIATTDRQLAHRLTVGTSQHVGHFGLEFPDSDHVALAPLGDLRSIRGLSCPAHNPQWAKASLYGVDADSEFFRKIRGASPFQVPRDQRVNVNIHPSRTPIASYVKLSTLGLTGVAKLNTCSQQGVLDRVVATSMFGSYALKSVTGGVRRNDFVKIQRSPQLANDLTMRGKRYPGVGEYGANASSVDAELLLKGIDATSSSIGVDKVVRVEVVLFSGHVYNLTTERGWFNYGPLYTGNTMGALNASRADAFQAFAEEDPDIEYERLWLATLGARTRESHRLADGQRVPLGDPFSVGGFSLAFPGDPSGPPEETINCRCTSLLLEKGETVDLSRRQLPRR